MSRILWALVGLLLLSEARGDGTEMFATKNLTAWCIVPFDAAKRGPEERAKMLERLGISRLAYDWRAEHVPSFDQEVEVMQRHGIEMVAWWLSGKSAADNQKIFAVIERHGIHPQLWIALDDPLPGTTDQAAKVAAAAEHLRPLAVEAKRLGCKLALYNHGGWFGEPENQIAIIKQLGMDNVGLVYNFHHGQGHIGRFPELMPLMKPYLLALNLSGMTLGASGAEDEIRTLGSGDRELAMIKEVVLSGWHGPVGILDHCPKEDSEVVLKRNILGLERLLQSLNGK
jgi:hypothetical protein